MLDKKTPNTEVAELHYDAGLARGRPSGPV